MNACILFYFEKIAIGPSQQALLALIESLDPKQHPFRILLPSYDGPLADYLRARKIDFDALTMPRGRGLLQKTFALGGYYRKLFRYFKMYPFEVVHTDGMTTNMLSIGLKMRFNTPLIWQLWSVVPGGSSLWVFCWLASMFCDHMIASCQLAAHGLGRILKWRAYLSILYRGYDLRTFANQSVVTKNNPHVGMCSDLSPWRGHKTFLRAVELVHRKIPSLTATILIRDELASDLSYRQELESLIEDLKLTNKVQLKKFDGSQDGLNLDGAISTQLKTNGVTIYVDPSLYSECFESGVAEALASSIPVIAARSGALTELISHEVTGMLVTAGDANLLAQTITKLIEEKEFSTKIAIAGKADFESRFHIERFRSAIVGLYSRFIKTSELDEVTQRDETDKSKAA